MLQRSTPSIVLLQAGFGNSEGWATSELNKNSKTTFTEAVIKQWLNLRLQLRKMRILS